MGPERKLINAVHRQLPKDIRKESNTGGGMGNGRPDYYYDVELGSGPGDKDLWVEWKAGKVLDDMWLRFEISQLQLNWIRRRHTNGRNAWIIVGDANVYYLVAALNMEVLRPADKQSKRFIVRAGFTKLGTAKETAGWIESFVSGKLGARSV